MTRVWAAAYVAGVCVALAASVAAQTDSAAPRTPYGDPDIQGIFTFRTLTPLQRPVIDAGASSLLSGRDALTAEEAAWYEEQRRKELNRDAQNLEVHAPGVRYQSRAEGGVGGYNEFWYERGIDLATAGVRTINIRSGFADSYTDRSLSDRCLMGFNAGPPMVSSAYNNNVLVVQTPDHVVILNEMVHNARVIPLDGRAHGTLRQYAGESRGRWEGDTLVILRPRTFWVRPASAARARTRS